MGRIGQLAWNRVRVDDEHLKHLYLDMGLSVIATAAAMGVSPNVLYRRLGELGITRNNSTSHQGVQARDNNPNWKGGRHRASNGYVRIQTDSGIRFEHQLVAEAALHRNLAPGEVVHHINGNRADNRPENLQVFATHAEHMKVHMHTTEARRRGAYGLAARYGRAALAAVGVEAG